MISISKNNDRLDRLALEYLNEVKSYFNIPDEINENDKKQDKLKRLFLGKRGLESKMIKFFWDGLHEIILSPPADLMQKHNACINFLKINYQNDKQHKKQFDKFKIRMEKYYHYFFSKQIIKNNEKITVGRWLVQRLDVKVCPYCNHNYTLTVNDQINGINFRPEFDHFYPKSDYPLLALSFYNLIPSCSTCNGLKRNKLIRVSPHNLQRNDKINFEFYGTDGDGENFLLGLGKEYKSIKIKPVTPSNAPENCNINVLGIEQVYANQIDYVQELMDKAQQYNKNSYDAMIKSYRGLGKTEAEIDRIIWSSYIDDNSKRPLSKLTNDLLVQIGIKVEVDN